MNSLGALAKFVVHQIISSWGIRRPKESFEFQAFFKITLHLLKAFPICRVFSPKGVKYFWSHMKDARIMVFFMRQRWKFDCYLSLHIVYLVDMKTIEHIKYWIDSS